MSMQYYHAKHLTSALRVHDVLQIKIVGWVGYAIDTLTEYIQPVLTYLLDEVDNTPV